MLLLSPPKLLMVLVIALIVLGPDKLPSMARRVGALWSEFSRWRAHVESEVRSTFPDLPSTSEITRAVRSPLSLLDRLADEHDKATVPVALGAPSGANGPRPAGPGASPSPPVDGRGDRRGLGMDMEPGPDVSSMN
jgi:Sec-independent protein translocase protein TatA